ncbi:hypothetical protein COU54_03735 [Candidatus Pacearchaeota archaeon CG10_big_fil_rev_8_21_14_0_10_31_24]|nr:MAG: hypothetical protein COU54_03735 [Candidatus Pacearchaeota archaeon CG10_big_fil_rev_8_21_14_0_10_31_24]
MSYKIIIGRNESDKKKFGDKGLIYLGKSYVNMGNATSLSNNLWMDVARSHVILVAGKRGSGKSHSLGVIAEELSNLDPESAKNISSLIFDTMGIFWTMKYPNEKEKPLLNSWNLEAKNLPINIIIPHGKVNEYKSKSIPFDETFALRISELEAEDWITLFSLKLTSLEGVLIENAINSLKSKMKNFSINDIQKEIDSSSNNSSKEIVKSLFRAASTWGIFSEDNTGTEINSLTQVGKTNVLDISTYSSVGSFNIRALIISLVSRKIFKTRMESRKEEELNAIQHGQEYLSYSEKRKSPLVWIFIDEAHEFLPKNEKTPATDALVQLLREGRQPGISLVLATQQPGQIHKDVMSQSDIVLSHRVTSKVDVEALNEIMQTYILESIKKQMDDLPDEKGSAIILDDNSERIYPMRVRPRFTWHGGESPSAIRSELNI